MTTRPFPPPAPSRSTFLRLRGLRMHLRRWGTPGAPLLLMAHGWLDVSATFAPLVQGLLPEFEVLMPDWRGFGHSEWPQDGYWFPDYVADLDALVEAVAPDGPIRLAGHSMGAQIASLYAGLRPDRVSHLALLDGLFLPDADVTTTPRHYTQWLDAVRRPQRGPTYRSFEELAQRVAKRHPRLSPENAAFIARCWGREEADGRIALLSDPRHLLEMPRPYRQAESDAIWAQVTAQTLFLDAERSPLVARLPAGERARRCALFRNHRCETVPDAGHMLHFDAPLETAARLKAFFLG